MRLRSAGDAFAGRHPRRVPFAARSLIALMRSVPALFTLLLLVLGGLWLAGGRTTAGAAMIAAAAGAMAFGLRIRVASRLEASSRGIEANRLRMLRAGRRPADPESPS
jgi:hypothetical protein